MNSNQKYILIAVLFLIAIPYISTNLSPASLSYANINSIPQGATVTSNDVIIGTTPFVYNGLPLYAGNVLIFSKNGYETKSYTITPMDTNYLEVTLKYIPTGTEFLIPIKTIITSTPYFAEVYDGNTLLGKTPYTLSLLSGESKVITLKLNHYESQTILVDYGDTTKYVSLKYIPTVTSTTPMPPYPTSSYTPSPTYTPKPTSTYTPKPTSTYTSQPTQTPLIEPEYKCNDGYTLKNQQCIQDSIISSVTDSTDNTMLIWAGIGIVIIITIILYLRPSKKRS